jgi:excisionase family DNA binding protein
VETREPRWISYKAACKHSGLSRGSLWKLVEAGHVPAAKVGRRVLLDREGLDEYLQRLSRGEE